jgi:hypothetical protein
LDGALVVLDVGEAHGFLVIGGDARRAEEVRAALAAQLEGGEVAVRGQDEHPDLGRPHWDAEVDRQRWITVVGRRFKFVRVPEPGAVAPVVPDQVADEVPATPAPRREVPLTSVAVSAESGDDPDEDGPRPPRPQAVAPEQPRPLANTAVSSGNSEH